MSETNRTVDTKGAVLAFNDGAVAAASGDEAKAAELWHRALDLDPGLLPAALNLITYYQNQDNLEAELDLWKLVVEFDPYDTDHLVLQAAAFRRAGQLERARDNYHKAIAIYPYFKFWYHELAGIYQELGQPEEGALWRGRGDSLGADEAEICYEDGLRHVSAERWKSARTCFEAVLEEFPANLDARLRLAKVLEKAGTADEVVGQYNRALELTEAAEGLVYYRLGEFHLKQGSLDNAEDIFSKALDSANHFRKADRALVSIRAHRARTQAAAASAEATAPPAESAAAQESGSFAGAKTVEDIEPIVLNPIDIGMEPIAGPMPEFVSPKLRSPNPRLPWPQQIRQVLDQALSVAAPGGHEPQVALVVEPDAELAEATRGVMTELRSLGRSLRADANVSHIFVVQAAPEDTTNGAVISGWLGRHDAAQLTASSWQRVKPGVAINEALRQIREAGSDQGFNCLIAVSFGRCYGVDDETADLMATTPLHAVCFIHPSYHYIDLRAALAEHVHNFIEVEL